MSCTIEQDRKEYKDKTDKMIDEFNEIYHFKGENKELEEENDYLRYHIKRIETGEE